MCLQTQSLVQRRHTSGNKRWDEDRSNEKQHKCDNIKSARGEQFENIISERPEQIRFIAPWLSLHPQLFADVLSLASWCRRTGRDAGLETLYTADRIILFLQLVLRCQCDSHMNMLHHT